MAIYSNLLLHSGGGITSTFQQVDPVEDTVTVLIGLGGTGIDCLTEIKKMVKEHLRPDNPDDEEHPYQHIKFLAVDADSLETASKILNSDECFELSFFDVQATLMQEHINKFDFEYRYWKRCAEYGLRHRTNDFLEKMKELITQARKNLAVSATRINVHVFSGVGGMAGGGMFLDVCYLIRRALREVTGGDGMISGYFFLPEVNLAKIPSQVTLVRKMVVENSARALKELDYCMCLPKNGGAFLQKDCNGEVTEWKEEPVDLCFLIDATDENRRIWGNAYWNSIKTVAGYVLHFLTKKIEDPENMLKLLHPVKMPVFSEKIETGYSGYGTIGGSYANIPLRNIHTYLACEIFERFAAVEEHIPTENDVQQIAERVRITKIESILSDLTKNGGGSDLAAIPGHLNWEFTRNNGDQELVDYYTKQKAEKIGIVEKNAKSMVSEQNKDSVIARICRELDECAKDLNRGPAYAYKVVQASFAGNLLNIIDGMIKNAEERKAHISYNVYDQPESAKKLYEESRDIWRAEQNRKLSGKPKKAYAQYVADLERYVRGQIEVEQLKQVLTVLREVRTQVSNKADEYYLRFNHVMENLISTFRENLRDIIAEEETGTFANPLLTIKEMRSIRSSLHKEVEKMDITDLMARFAECMFFDKRNGQLSCFTQAGIVKAVNDFIEEIVSCDFKGSSIEPLLQGKLPTNGKMSVDEYYKILLEMYQRASVLYPINCIYKNREDSIALTNIDVPLSNTAVIDAAEIVAHHYGVLQFEIEQSQQENYISMVRTLWGLSLAAYDGNLQEKISHSSKRKDKFTT